MISLSLKIHMYQEDKTILYVAIILKPIYKPR